MIRPLRLHNFYRLVSAAIASGALLGGSLAQATAPHDTDHERSASVTDSDTHTSSPAAVPRSDACPATDLGTLSSGGGSFAGDTTGFTNDFEHDYDCPCFGYGSGGADEIFTFQVDTTGVWEFNTCTQGWDPSLGIREDTGGGCPGTPLNCNGDSGPFCGGSYYEALLSVYLTTGTDYFLVVDGWNAAQQGSLIVDYAIPSSGTSSWANGSDGLFEDPLKWSGEDVPGQAETALFNENDPDPGYTVSFNSCPTTAGLDIGQDIVTLDLNGNQYDLNGSLRLIAGGASETSSLEITDGTVQVNSPARVIVGDGPATDTSAFLTLTGSSASLTAHELYIGGYIQLGDATAGTLTIQDGADVTVTGTNSIRVGSFAGDTGTINLDDTGSTLTCTAGGLSLGTFGGDGILNVAGGGSVNCGNVTVSGTGTLSVTGGSGVSGDLVTIGNSAAGFGDVLVSGTGSTLIASGGVDVGLNDGDASVIVAAGGSIVSTGGPNLDTSVIHGGGTCDATVIGASSIWSHTGGFEIGTGSSGSAVLTVQTGGVFDQTAGPESFLIGQVGQLRVLAGGTVRTGGSVTPNAQTEVSFLNGSGPAIANVTGAGALWQVYGDLVVGLNGPAQVTVGGGGLIDLFNVANLWVFPKGEINVTAGGTLRNVGWVDVGLSIGGPETAMLNVTGAAALWEPKRRVRIGDSGPGVLSVSSGGTVEHTMTTFTFEVGPFGEVDVTSGGTIRSGGTGSPGTETRIGTAPGGTATATVDDVGSLWETHGPTEIGVDGPASLTVSTDGLFFASSDPLTIGPFGDVNVLDGLFLSNGPLTVGSGAGGTANVDVDLGGRWEPSNSVTIGVDGPGSVNVNHTGSVFEFQNSFPLIVGPNGLMFIGNGGNLFTNDGTTTISAPGVGLAVIDVAGTGAEWDSFGPINVGTNGRGLLQVRSGAAVNSTGSAPFVVGPEGEVEVTLAGTIETAGDVTIGQSGAGTATVSIDGAGSRWDLAGSTTIGEAGPAELTMQGGGVFQQLTTDAVRIGPEATVDIQNLGAFYLTGSATVGTTPPGASRAISPLQGGTNGGPLPGGMATQATRSASNSAEYARASTGTASGASAWPCDSDSAEHAHTSVGMPPEDSTRLGGAQECTSDAASTRPGGAQECTSGVASTRPGGAQDCSHGWSSAQPDGTRGTDALIPSRPGGAKEAFLTGTLRTESPSPLPGRSDDNDPIHGFRSARLGAGCAPPVATLHGPSGTEMTADANARGPSNTATINVDGADALWTFNDLSFGEEGRAQLNVTNGGVAQSNDEGVCAGGPMDGLQCFDESQCIPDGTCEVSWVADLGPDARIDVSDNGTLVTRGPTRIGTTYFGKDYISPARISVVGANARWDNYGDLEIGGEGLARLTLGNGGVVEDHREGATAGVRLDARIYGTGTMTGDYLSEGRLYPGESPGTLTITGNYTQLAEGELIIEIEGGLAGEYDVVNISGTATLDGKLIIQRLGGYTPALNDTFTIMTFASLSGTFAEVETPPFIDAGEGLTFRVDYNATDVTLTVVADCNFNGVPDEIETATIAEETKLVASSAPDGDESGDGVAIQGDRLVVGDPLEDCTAGADCGAAYVFERRYDGWTQTARLTASDAAANDKFGGGMAIRGNTIMIGAHGAGCTAGGGCGAVYVYEYDGAQWNESQILTAGDAAGADFLGFDVAIDGDTMVTGADGADCVAGANCGAAYVFVYNGSSWVQQQKLVATDADVEDRFGTSVAVSGDTVVVGAPGDACGSIKCGAVYVFQRSGVTWSQVDKLTGSDTNGFDFFGFSVAIAPGRIVAGATGTPNGAAYVFDYDGSAWSQTVKITAGDGASGDQFGNAVGLWNNRLTIGSPLADCTGGDCGAVYVYDFDGSSWGQIARLAPSDLADGDAFGRSVAADGYHVVAGAPAQSCCGSAYVFDVQPGDCDGNGVPDSCQIDQCSGPMVLTCADCNNNGVLDICDINAGLLHDADFNEIADECVFYTGGGATMNWTDPDNWDLGGDYPDNDVVQFHVNIAGAGSDVVLDTDITINTLNLLGGASLAVSGGNLTVLNDKGIRVDGDTPGLARAAGFFPPSQGGIKGGSVMGVPSFAQAKGGVTMINTRSTPQPTEDPSNQYRDQIPNRDPIPSRDRKGAALARMVEPEGTQEWTPASASTRPGGAQDCSHGWSSAQPNGTRGTDALITFRPGGAKEALLNNASRTESPSPLPGRDNDYALIHGFRSARHSAGGAPPVATLQGPSGTEMTMDDALSEADHRQPTQGEPMNKAALRGLAVTNLQILNDKIVSAPSMHVLNGGQVLLDDNSVLEIDGQLKIDDDGSVLKVGAPGAGVTASIDAGSIEINSGACANGTSGGQLSIDDDMSLTVDGDLVLNGTSEDTCGVLRGILPPPKLFVGCGGASLRLAPAFAVGGNLVINGGARVSIYGGCGALRDRAAGQELQVSGDVINHATKPFGVDWTNAGIEFTDSADHNFEVAGRDIGPVDAGLSLQDCTRSLQPCETEFCGDGGSCEQHTNNSFASVRIGADADVTFVDQFDNENWVRGAQEALYVGTLYVATGATVTVDKCSVYYRAVVPPEAEALVDTVNGGRFEPLPISIGPPLEAPFPHNRPKNRYLSFDPNKALNDGINVAFKVELTSINMGSCNDATGGNVDFCRIDRGTDDCGSCVGGLGGTCINTAIHCSTGGGVCTPTGATCVNDAPNSGGSNVGQIWWVGPEHASANGVHLLVSAPFRKESANWGTEFDPVNHPGEYVVHVGDCEIVPQASYGVRAVDVGGGSESAELVVETTTFPPTVPPAQFWWADAIGALQFFCNGDINQASCTVETQDADCGPGIPCLRAWTLPNGSVNFDDVNAALTQVAPPGVGVPAEKTWVDLHGGAGDAPPNGILNSSDLQQFIFGFGGFPYTGYDPKDCPDAGTWP